MNFKAVPAKVLRYIQQIYVTAAKYVTAVHLPTHKVGIVT